LNQYNQVLYNKQVCIQLSTISNIVALHPNPSSQINNFLLLRRAYVCHMTASYAFYSLRKLCCSSSSFACMNIILKNYFLLKMKLAFFLIQNYCSLFFNSKGIAFFAKKFRKGKLLNVKIAQSKKCFCFPCYIFAPACTVLLISIFSPSHKFEGHLGNLHLYMGGSYNLVFHYTNPSLGKKYKWFFSWLTMIPWLLRSKSVVLNLFKAATPLNLPF
jgi:hypothetical protein